TQYIDATARCDLFVKVLRFRPRNAKPSNRVDLAHDNRSPILLPRPKLTAAMPSPSSEGATTSIPSQPARSLQGDVVPHTQNPPGLARCSDRPGPHWRNLRDRHVSIMSPEDCFCKSCRAARKDRAKVPGGRSG